MISKNFVLGGAAIFTVTVSDVFAKANKCKAHYTYRVTKKEACGNYPETFFVSLLSGPDNENDYRYVGIVDRNGSIRTTKKSSYDSQAIPVQLANRVLMRIFAGQGQMITAAGFDVKHEGRCARCARLLTEPESIDSGFGPICREKMIAEAV